MLFCKHPLEWDKTKYDSALIRNRLCSGDEGLHDILREKAEKLDIWGSIKDNETIRQPANNLWFAHPVYFINHMNKAGLLDKTFNPYYNKKTIERDGKKVHVVDNPGFAPKYKERVGNDYEGDIFKNPHTDESFAVPTGIFGQWYEAEKRWHEGVDFRGDKEAPVYSLIHAKVIECGEMGHYKTYGKVVIFANEQDKGIYLIAHLDSIENGIEKGVSVSPNDIVGYVGTSGGVKPHLHVSYYDVQYDRNSEESYAYMRNGYVYFGGHIGYNNPSEKNPFWHNSGSCADKNNATNA
jgi:murein DD-endopeptidase MepM/ murein hydrolase activator NlpD